MLASHRFKIAMITCLLAGALLLALKGSAFEGHAGSPSSQTFSGNTWSIVAADPKSGDVGLALASCVPDLHVDMTAALVPGMGVAATQAEFDLANRDRVFDMLLAGETAEDIVATMSDPGLDPRVSSRQYGVVTLADSQSQVAAFTGSANAPWAGDRQNPAFPVTVQGNYLVGEEVVTSAMAAFERDDPSGNNALPDRLMRALEAGSAAGGDARCNSDQVRQTAATAYIMVARGGDAPYVAGSLGATDAGTPAGPWLALSVAGPRFGPNAVAELRGHYDAWRADNPMAPDEGPASTGGSPMLVALALVTAAILIVLVVVVALRRTIRAGAS